MGRAKAAPVPVSPEQILAAYGGDRPAYVEGIDDDISAEFDSAKRWVIARSATLSMCSGPVRFNAGTVIDDLPLAREIRDGGVDIRPYVGAK